MGIHMVVLMFSTMVMVVLFFRLIERIHLAVSESGENLGHGHGDLGLTKEQTKSLMKGLVDGTSFIGRCLYCIGDWNFTIKTSLIKSNGSLNLLIYRKELVGHDGCNSR